MGVEHNACTTIDGDPNPWCSTLVDENGVHVPGGGHWEYCTSSECPTIQQPEMCVHPGNQPGSCCKFDSIIIIIDIISPACGIPNALTNTRIVGGVETEIGEYPWQVINSIIGRLSISPQKNVQVALLFGTSVVNQGCGGALVADRYVVTAAHCTDGQQASGLKVVVGDIYGIYDIFDIFC